MKSPSSCHRGSFKQGYGSKRAEDTIRYLALGEKEAGRISGLAVKGVRIAFDCVISRPHRPGD
ncbi:hypothetical protein ES703_72245 [subsurface metagenome]